MGENAPRYPIREALRDRYPAGVILYGGLTVVARELGCSVQRVHQVARLEGYVVEVRRAKRCESCGRLSAARSGRCRECSRLYRDEERACPVCGVVFTWTALSQRYRATNEGSGAAKGGPGWEPTCSPSCGVRLGIMLNVGTVNCVVCGRAFRSNRPALARYCSRECSPRRLVPPPEPVEVACAVCGGGFLTERPESARYCSPRCKERAKDRRRAARRWGVE